MLNTLQAFFFSILMVGSPAHAFLWGPASYEECYAEEMKDRPRSQATIIRNLCRKKFPKLSSFAEIDHTGELYCEGFFPDPPIWTLKASATKLTFEPVPNLTLVIKRRNRESLFADVSEPNRAIRVRISFLTGEGEIWIDETRSISFTCSES